eukprot:CAMPEP_0197022412 /NCGR_PEP_ID=MMETSP1384-20130603/3309_1 /TAXON_ID=29189 /ORGANISM="Ammonia sp." /LENGTH=327 /DNA_ID=CAMNT_0042450455 /DNA_START=20 /DNA_END=1003 /DNA_ORIENTATION=+
MPSSASTKQHNQSSGVKNAIAGVCAGVLTKSTVQPLDFIRTRLQCHDCIRGDYSMTRTIYNIFSNEGVLSLYRGLSANLLGSGVNWGIYFFSYESIKSFFLRHQQQHADTAHSHHKLSSTHHFIAGTVSGLTAISVTNPIWCVKTRMQLQDKSSPTAYRGILDCFSRIIKEEGMLNLYRGLGPAYILVLNPALQFTFYEKIKSIFMEFHLYYDAETDSHSDLGSADFLIMGAMAKMMSSTTVYPMQLIRARLFQTEKRSMLAQGMQDVVVLNNKYDGVFHCAKSIIVKEGVTGFYKGLAVNLIKTVPSSALTFMFYENSMKILNHYC